MDLLLMLKKTKQNNVLEFNMLEKDKLCSNRGIQVMNHGVEHTNFLLFLCGLS